MGVSLNQNEKLKQIELKLLKNIFGYARIKLKIYKWEI